MVKMVRLFSALIALLLLPVGLAANEHYLLPEHKTDLIHTLKRKIERAENITLIVTELDDASLGKSIEKALRRGASLELITPDMQTAAYYAKYRNTAVRVPSNSRSDDSFTLNILLIDKSDVCFSTVGFNETQLGKATGMAVCTTQKEEIDFASGIEKRLHEHFENY